VVISATAVAVAAAAASESVGYIDGRFLLRQRALGNATSGQIR